MPTPLSRDSKEYKELKLAHELTTLPVWQDFLEPMLIEASRPANVTIESMNDAFMVASLMAKRNCAAWILNRVHRLAKEFVMIKVAEPGTPTE